MEEYKTLKSGEIIIPVPNEIMMELERVYFEYNGLLTLVSQYGSDTPFKPDFDRFEFLLDKYMEAYTIYNITFTEISRNYVPIELLTKVMTASFELSAFLIK